MATEVISLHKDCHCVT